LERTAEIAELSETDEETTVRIRRFDGEKLILYATGWFVSNQRRHRYRETIAKILIDTEALGRTMAAVGWASLDYTADDYRTPVDNPEDGVRAYGVAWKG
jgi:hypothetical protein